MDYLEKYQKYKSKYIKLKKQIGGNDELVHVVYTTILTLFPENFDKTKIKNQKLLFIKLCDLMPYAGNIVKNINSILPNKLKSEKFNLQTVPFLVVPARNVVAALYDSIALFYLSSHAFQSFWMELQEELDIKIKIFYAETDSLKVPEFKNNHEHFIEGLNILLSCNSNQLAHDLNTRYNNKKKFFVGFKFFAHAYGTSFIRCLNALNCLNNYFLESDEYKAIIGDNPPVIQLLKLMFYLFKNDCSKCRDCAFFNKDILRVKITRISRIMKDPDPTKSKLGENESNFQMNQGIDCSAIDCLLDPEFEDFIRAKLEEPELPKESYDYSNKNYFID